MIKHPTLLVRFTFVSLCVTALIAVGFSLLISRQMIEDALNNAVQDAAKDVTTVVTPAVTAEDFAAPTPSSIVAWERRLGGVVGGMDIARVKVWNVHGQVVYSDDRTLIGKSFPLEPEDELREALEGHLAKDLSALKKSENEGERTYGRLIEIYVPVILRGSSQVVGVYEVYRKAAPLEARIATIKKLIWGGSAAAFSLLYVSLFIVVSRASRQLSREQEAKLAADRGNQAKSEFLSRMSHELRTPLNAILGFAQLLGMDNPTSEQRESVGHILKAGRHLLELINEVLDITRIETGHLALSADSVPVGEVVRETLDLITPLAVEMNVHLNIKAADTHPEQYILADRQRIKQVLLNLLANAVKYNRRGGTVAIFYMKTPEGRLRINVIDTGPGIAPDKLRRLFTPFERLGAEQTGIEGTGLGLALSKRLVEAMGGTLGVESAVGRGSTFWIEFALTAVPASQPEEERTDLPGPAESAASRGTRTVLYVEDNLSSLELIQRLLDHRPETKLLSAMQGQMGLDLAREHRPDVILLDLYLPDIPGDEVMRLLKRDSRTRQIPVVIISAEATTGQIQRLLAAGARAYLTKPLDVKKFLELLDLILREHPREGRLHREHPVA